MIAPPSGCGGEGPFAPDPDPKETAVLMRHALAAAAAIVGLSSARATAKNNSAAKMVQRADIVQSSVRRRAW